MTTRQRARGVRFRCTLGATLGLLVIGAPERASADCLGCNVVQELTGDDGTERIEIPANARGLLTTSDLRDSEGALLGRGAKEGLPARAGHRLVRGGAERPLYFSECPKRRRPRDDHRSTLALTESCFHSSLAEGDQLLADSQRPGGARVYATIVGARPVPTTLGKLTSEPPRWGTLVVGDDMPARIDAFATPVVATLSADVAPWLSVMRITTLVDGKRWRVDPNDCCLNRNKSRFGLARDMLLLGPTLNHNSPAVENPFKPWAAAAAWNKGSPGRHRVQMIGELAGYPTIRTNTIVVHIPANPPLPTVAPAQLPSLDNP